MRRSDADTDRRTGFEGASRLRRLFTTEPPPPDVPERAPTRASGPPRVQPRPAVEPGYEALQRLQRRLRPAAFSLYLALYLAARSSPDCTCRIGFAELRSQTGFSRNTLRRHLRALTAVGLIETAAVGDAVTPTTYRVTPPHAAPGFD